MKILFFTKYSSKGSSSRYRIYNYLNLYKKHGLIIKSNALLGDWYFNKPSRISFFLYLILSFSKRFFTLLNTRKFDLVYIEYELFPYFPSYFEKLLVFFDVKFIVDYDDAIFHTYNTSNNILIKTLLSHKIDKVMSLASCVITGSPYLTDYALAYNKNVFEIPTSLNVKYYNNNSNFFQKNVFIIGWIGSKSTSINLLDLIPAFHRLKSKIPFQINLIGFDSSLENKFLGLNVKFIEWNSKTEVSEINNFDVGIMPLRNNQWNIGKCGFKLIQYMACAKPTISTPLVANLKINGSNSNLFASTEDEWHDALLKVYQNLDYYFKVGDENYKRALNNYNNYVNYEKYMILFNNMVKK